MPPLQTHRFIHSPTTVTDTASSQRLRCKPISSSPSLKHASQHDINLSLTQHPISAIDKVLTMTMVHDSAHLNLFHPNIPIKINHLRRLHTTMRSSNNHHLPYRFLYHHLLISARSPLTLRDRYLSLTMDNADEEEILATRTCDDESSTYSYCS